MKRKYVMPPRPMEAVASHGDTTQADTPAPTSGLSALTARATQEILAVTYWFDPLPQRRPYPVTIRFSGRRAGVQGRLQAGDQFVYDNTIAEVIPGSGPIAATLKVEDITPGDWIVTARVVETAHGAHGRREHASVATAAEPRGPLARFWRNWAPSVASGDAAEPAHTCLRPLARTPGALLGAWAGLVGLGMVVALVMQALLLARIHLVVGPALLVTLLAIAVGAIGAKVWHMILHPGERRLEGWCIQGFVLGASVTAALLLAVLRAPTGVILDATAPGLLLAMAIGRIGCFFAGCCGGPPTAAWWGVWSSDQHVGARRVPTQLLESALALSVGLVALAVFLGRGPAGGALFVAALSAYTLGRQGILSLRAEQRKTRFGGPVTAALAALALVGAVVALVV